MTTTISRRLWLQRTAMAAAILPVARWYDPAWHGLQQSYPKGTDIKSAIKLNSNENAYGPGDAARKAILDSLSDTNRYPWGHINQLKEEIAAREGLTPDHVLITAGSTELLGLAGLYFGLHGGELLACTPTFDFLMLYAEKLGCKWARTPLASDHQYDLHALGNLAGPDTKLIFVCNPNNPTGIEIPYDELKKFCISYGSTYPLYVDEAYIELSPAGRSGSMSTLIGEVPKLIVARTFSKVHGLAGMRIGYALAQPDIVEELSNMSIGRSMTLSVPAAAAAIASLQDHGFEEFSRSKINTGRSMVTALFDQWGIAYMPSATNFVFFKNDRFHTDPLEAMAKENILVRQYNHFPGWTRVSIGTVEEMERFLDAVQKYIS